MYYEATRPMGLIGTGGRGEGTYVLYRITPFFFFSAGRMLGSLRVTEMLNDDTHPAAHFHAVILVVTV